MEVSTVNPTAGAPSQDSGQQHAADDINLQSQLQKAQLIKTSTNNDNSDNGNHVNNVAAGITTTNNSLAKNNNSLPASYNGDAHQNMATTNSELDSNTNNNINANSSVPANLFELDPVQLEADIKSFLKNLVERVVDKFKHLEGEETTQQQQQLTYNSAASGAIITTTTTTTTTTAPATPLDSTSPTSIDQANTPIQSNQEQSNQVSVEQSNVELVDNNAVDEQQHDRPDLSPDEVTSDLVIDAGDLQEETPVAPEQTENSTDGDDDNDNTNETQQTPSKVEPAIGGGEELVCSTEATASTITATATPAILSQPDENKLDGDVCKASNSATVDHTDQELGELKNEEEKAKEMVTLRNLEISPPPPSASATTDVDTSIGVETIDTIEQAESANSQAGSTEKRKRTASTSTTDQNESLESGEGGRSKRRRTQTKLFQVGETKSKSHDDSTTSIASSRSRASTKASSRSSRKKSTNSSTTSESANISANDSITHQPPNPANDLQDVIFYEKNDYLAIRNEENTFYLCQLTENVRSKRPTIRVKWLDTSNDGKTYFLTSHYDMVPQKSIIMVVGLNKLKSEKKGEQLFSLADYDKDQIMERLKRSLSFSGNS